MLEDVSLPFVRVFANLYYSSSQNAYYYVFLPASDTLPPTSV
jgi:hypothetical protein